MKNAEEKTFKLRSPLPFTAHFKSMDDSSVRDADGYYVVATNGVPVFQEDMEFIATACNGYQKQKELIDLLVDALKGADRLIDGEAGANIIQYNVVNQIGIALKAAKEMKA